VEEGTAVSVRQHSRRDHPDGVAVSRCMQTLTAVDVSILREERGDDGLPLQVGVDDQERPAVGGRVEHVRTQSTSRTVLD